MSHLSSLLSSLPSCSSHTSLLKYFCGVIGSGEHNHAVSRSPTQIYISKQESYRNFMIIR